MARRNIFLPTDNMFVCKWLKKSLRRNMLLFKNVQFWVGCLMFKTNLKLLYKKERILLKFLIFQWRNVLIIIKENIFRNYLRLILSDKKKKNSIQKVSWKIVNFNWKCIKFIQCTTISYTRILTACSCITKILRKTLYNYKTIQQQQQQQQQKKFEKNTEFITYPKS